MLRFEEQDEFEAWLRRCPLPMRALTYGVSLTGQVLSVECQWRLPAQQLPGAKGTASKSPTDVEATPAAERTCRPPRYEMSARTAATIEAESRQSECPPRAQVTQQGSLPPDEDAKAQIALLQGSMARMQSMLASRSIMAH